MRVWHVGASGGRLVKPASGIGWNQTSRFLAVAALVCYSTGERPSLAPDTAG